MRGKPKQLTANEGLVIEGPKVLGMGFILETEEAQELIARNPRNKEVLFPFLTGQDLNSRVDKGPSRWVIYFFDWPLDRKSAPSGYSGPVADDYPDCLGIVEERVKPDRLAYPPDSAWNRAIRERWWQFGLPRPALLKAIKGRDRVLVRSAVSNLNSFAFGQTDWVFSHAIKVFIFEDYANFAFLQSSLHTEWLEKYASRMKTDIRYTPETCFDTLPFPNDLTALSGIGKHYYELRDRIISMRQEGLTKIYSRFHDPSEVSDDLNNLRELHLKMDHAVVKAYGWNDLELDHGFHETKQGLRFTLSRANSNSVLDRLLSLNHERYENEERAGVHDKKVKAAGRKIASLKNIAETPAAQGELL